MKEIKKFTVHLLPHNLLLYILYRAPRSLVHLKSAAQNDDKSLKKYFLNPLIDLPEVVIQFTL